MTIAATTSIPTVPTLSLVQARQLAAASTAQSQSQTQATPPPTLTYATPVYRYDNLANLPIEIFRDPTTGTVTNQIPSEQVVKKYEQGQLKNSLGGVTSDPSSDKQSALSATTTQTASKLSTGSVAAATAAAGSAAPSSVSLRV